MSLETGKPFWDTRIGQLTAYILAIVLTLVLVGVMWKVLFATAGPAVSSTVVITLKPDSGQAGMSQTQLALVRMAEVLDAKIEKVEEVETQKHQTLTWALSSLFTLLIALAVFNFVNASAAAKERVIDEFQVFKTKYEDMDKEVKSKLEELNTIIKQLTKDVDEQNPSSPSDG